MRQELVLVIGLGLSYGIRTAHHNEKHESVKVLASRDMAEKMDGKEAKAAAVEVILEPWSTSDPHHHPGPAFGYVLEGEYEWAIGDRRPAGQGDEGRRDVRRTRWVSAPGVQEPRRQG